MNQKRVAQPARPGSHSPEPNRAVARRRRRRWPLALAAAFCLGAAALGYISWSRGGWPVRQSGIKGGELPLSPGEPPVDAAAVLSLPAELPQTVEEFQKESLAVGTLLVKTLPDRPEAHAQMALSYLQVGQDEAALESWRKALATDGKFPAAYLGVGTILAAKGEDERAIAALRQALELDPESNQAYPLLTEVLLRQGRADEALAVAREAVKRFPGAYENHFWLGQTCLQLGDYREALRCHEEAVRINPNWTVSYHSLALACARLGNSEEAARYRERFAALKAADMKAERERGKVYNDLATQKQALVKRHVLAGALQLQLGDLRMAEAHWLRAAAIAPDDTATREALVSLYEKQSRAAAAIGALDELIQLEPEDVIHRLRKGRLLVGLGAWADARRTLDRVLAMQPEQAEAHLLLADMYLRSGSDLSAAALHAEQAARLDPSDRSLLLLAAIRAERGDRRGARSALEQAISLDPDNPQIRQAYEQLLDSR